MVADRSVISKLLGGVPFNDPIVGKQLAHLRFEHSYLGTAHIDIMNIPEFRGFQECQETDIHHGKRYTSEGVFK